MPPPPRRILLTNDDGPPSDDHSPFIEPFIAALQARLGWHCDVVIPSTPKSWIGHGITLDVPVTQTYYDPASRSETESQPSHPGFLNLISGTPTTCVNVALNHLLPDPGSIDLVLSGPNLGRNSSAGSTLCSGTVGAALEGALLGKRAIALSFAFNGRDAIRDAAAVANAIDTALFIITRLWDRWNDAVDLYNVNIVIAPPPMREIRFAPFQPGGYASLYRPATASASDRSGPPRTFKFRPAFSSSGDIVVGSDTWCVLNGVNCVTPMKARFDAVPVEDHERGRIFGNL